MKKRGNGEGSWYTKKVNGNTYYAYSKNYLGKRKTFYGKTKSEVMEKIRKFEEQGSIVLNSGVQADTFYNYAHDWLYINRKKNIKQKTFDYYDAIIENYIKDTDLGKTHLRDINKLTRPQCKYIISNHFQKFKDKSRSTNAGIYTVLNQICRYGLNSGDLSVDYMDGIDKPSEQDVSSKQKELSALTYEELMLLWDEMQRKNSRTFTVNGAVGSYVYGIAAYGTVFCGLTGLRWGEACCLQWKDIECTDDGRKYIRIIKQYNVVKDRSTSSNKTKGILDTPKSKKSNRYIPLSNKCLELLDLIRERFQNDKDPNHLIFSITDKPVSNSNADRVLRSMCDRAEVKRVSVHELRHTFASILLNQDEKNLYTVAELLGHSSPDVTYKKYIDIFEKNKIDTINIFDKLGEDK